MDPLENCLLFFFFFFSEVINSYFLFYWSCHFFFSFYFLYVTFESENYKFLIDECTLCRHDKDPGKNLKKNFFLPQSLENVFPPKYVFKNVLPSNL